MLKVGDKIKIISMEGEPQYSGKTGIVTRLSIDHLGNVQVWGTWGGCCLYEGKDTYELLGKVQ